MHGVCFSKPSRLRTFPALVGGSPGALAWLLVLRFASFLYRKRFGRFVRNANKFVKGCPHGAGSETP